MEKAYFLFRFLALAIALTCCFLAGCNGGSSSTPSLPPISPSYGWVRICSGDQRIYGSLYIDGTYEGYVPPRGCTLVWIRLGVYHSIRIGDWVGNFFPESSGETWEFVPRSKETENSMRSCPGTS